MHSTAFAICTATALLATVRAHADGPFDLAINPALGVPGYPDCKRRNPGLGLTVEEAALDLVCVVWGRCEEEGWFRVEALVFDHHILRR